MNLCLRVSKKSGEICYSKRSDYHVQVPYGLAVGIPGCYRGSISLALLMGTFSRLSVNIQYAATRFYTFIAQFKVPTRNFQLVTQRSKFNANASHLRQGDWRLLSGLLQFLS